MNEFKEFQGKNLDEAIEAACRHYDLNRDKLEIEIIGGGSTGIFGLVGVKKAAVKARPRKAINLQEMAPERQEPKTETPKAEAQRPSETPRAEPPLPEPAAVPLRPETPRQPPYRPAFAPREDVRPAPAPMDEAHLEEEPGDAQPDMLPPADAQPQAAEPRQDKPRQERERGRRDRRRGGGDRERRPERQRQPRSEKPRPAPQDNGEAEDVEEGLPKVDMTTLDPQALELAVRETLVKLLTPMIPEPKLNLEIVPDRVNVFIEDEENSGLIIGREGQTLASLQYLLNRIVARRMQCSVRVQIDTGEYRERQDEKLRQMALHLAEKADTTGRTQSTKPLSSYHRRVVHVTLQDNETVFTRSKGEGPMKRVLIVPKRRGNGK
ncbi:Jag N-terminal domain-containing protein [Desulfovibrio aminophilus]|nr:Jag N-terminal domain-containing protein [Desulfovibrio aminophilus]MCM0756859.1 Jag N-terminal domain-containing protein [Desulfovibrio aminophilus]